MYAKATILAAVAVFASGVVAKSGRMTWFNPSWRSTLRTTPGVPTAEDGSPSRRMARQPPPRVADLCPGCPANGIDVSPAIFDDIADLSVGVVQVNWFFQ
ncbi:hypothetical protein NUW58_g4191 [Xylaria curta]|uniref:Uncharacterized protein n=1 Tax=Xylaria curta TaxID=42375 RepID=A0ACC1P8E3_9PEZI|nr:hypothetical protein NUW58_g4191 [Xylaria curta]